MKSRWVEVQALLELALVHWSTSAEDAAVVLVDALVGVERTGSPIQARQGLRLAMLVLERLDRQREAMLLRHSAGRDVVSVPPPPDIKAEIVEFDRRASDRLDASTVEALFDRGRRMSDLELVDLARRALVPERP